MSLDVPVSRNVLSGSPVLCAKQFKLPDFTEHVDECDCFFCTSAEYQLTLLGAIHAEANMNAFLKNSITAEDYFSGALRYYCLLEQMAPSYGRKAAKLLGADLLLSTKVSFSQNYCWLLLDYGNFLLENGK